MIWKCSQQWLVAVLLWLPKVNLQMPMMPYMPPPMPPPPPMPAMMPPPMFYPPPPPMPVPPPPPIAFQIVQIQEPKKSPPAEKNEKDEKTIGIAIPMSFPAPMQYNMPPPFGPPPPPPPPSPGAYSQPSQIQYGPPIPREQNQYRSAPSPQYQVMRKSHARPRLWRDKSFERAEYPSSEWTWKKSRKRKRSGRGLRKSHIRSPFDSDMNYDEFAKPVLSYISNDGDVKLEKRLSDDEAAELMDERQGNHKVEVTAQEDEEKRQSVKIVSSVDNANQGEAVPRSSGSHRSRQVLMRSGQVQHMLGEGKKELVFKPPTDKKISNLSVSFQIT